MEEKFGPFLDGNILYKRGVRGGYSEIRELESDPDYLVKRYEAGSTKQTLDLAIEAVTSSLATQRRFFGPMIPDTYIFSEGVEKENQPKFVIAVTERVSEVLRPPEPDLVKLDPRDYEEYAAQLNKFIVCCIIMFYKNLRDDGKSDIVDLWHHPEYPKVYKNLIYGNTKKSLENKLYLVDGYPLAYGETWEGFVKAVEYLIKPLENVYHFNQVKAVLKYRPT